MEKSGRSKSHDLFIVDNSDSEWKVLQYLHEWCDIAHTFDIATGYFEIGSLLALDPQWQKLDKIRILMGDEVSRRTQRAFIQALDQAKQTLDNSIEAEKEQNDFLVGVPAIVEALQSGRIECRVYRKDKFHAKAYITHAKHAVVGPSALVGSSNFTYPGLTDNVELNVQLRREVEQLQNWYEQHWAEAEDITPEILRVIERHIRNYTPFEVYVKALYEYFKGHEMTAEEWEQAGPDKGSRMYPILDRYQQDGYHALLKIARRYGGAFLCDGVGLGKTFVGLMLIERLTIHERKNVVLFAPKTARQDVWDRDLKKYLPHVGSQDFSRLAVFNHTDLGRGGEYLSRLDRIKEMADIVIIDEAHHFRNPGIAGKGERRPSRYRILNDLMEGPNGVKKIFMLTATPINNKLADFRYMVNLFARTENYFASTIGIHSIRGHFITMERALKKMMGEMADTEEFDTDTNIYEAEQVLQEDQLFRELVVQRSRRYVMDSQLQHGDALTCFPTREAPKVAQYSVKKTYGRLLDMVEEAFAKQEPLFSLVMYYPLAYYKGKDTSIDPFIENRQKQVVRLIRIQFLKRFESSAWAFERSCDRLLIKLLAWVERHSETEAELKRLDRWKRMNADIIGYVHQHQMELFGTDEEDEQEEDIITEEMLEHVDYLKRDEYKVDEMLDETFLDLDQTIRFLQELRKFDVKHDDKLKALVKLLKTDSVLKEHKVLIFSEFADTARYLQKYLIAAGIQGVDEIDSGKGSKNHRSDVIRRFAPYYNGTTSAELASAGETEIRVLISTDVLSEGLNLQDATRLINYDIHWNPVRLMQRIGRVDRRMNPETEALYILDHPEVTVLRGKVAYWNFLPPDELNELMGLFNRVTHKTLRISKTFGIEGKKLLTPQDNFDALREFNEAYEGSTTATEKLHLDYQSLLDEHPELHERLQTFPGRVFSGRRCPGQETKAIFFCYALPRPDVTIHENDNGPVWTEEAGECRWYLYDLGTERIHEETAEIIDYIRSDPDTSRVCEMEHKTLREIRLKIEKHIKNTYLRRFQAPVGVKPVLKCWMELN